MQSGLVERQPRLGLDEDGKMFIMGEHAERLWLRQRHAQAIDAMIARHSFSNRWLPPPLRPDQFRVRTAIQSPPCPTPGIVGPGSVRRIGPTIPVVL